MCHVNLSTRCDNQTGPEPLTFRPVQRLENFIVIVQFDADIFLYRIEKERKGTGSVFDHFVCDRFSFGPFCVWPAQFWTILCVAGSVLDHFVCDRFSFGPFCVCAERMIGQIISVRHVNQTKPPLPACQDPNTVACNRAESIQSRKRNGKRITTWHFFLALIFL